MNQSKSKNLAIVATGTTLLCVLGGITYGVYDQNRREHEKSEKMIWEAAHSHGPIINHFDVHGGGVGRVRAH